MQKPDRSQALSGVRVLDLGQRISGPYCARLLGDQGADVIKIEPPGAGDPERHAGPFAGDDVHPEKGLSFLYLNYNKRSLTLDVATPDGRELLLALAQDADIVIENDQPGGLSAKGLGFDRLREANSEIILTSITEFGQTGCRSGWRGNDLIAYAVSGAMYISGSPAAGPLKHGENQSGYVGGLAGVIPTLAALLARDPDGEARHVDVSIAEALSSTLVIALPFYAYMGEVPRRRDAATTAYGNCTPTRDGWIIPHSARSGDWDTFCSLIGEPKLAERRFATPRGKVEHAEELDRILREALARCSRYELFHQANERGLLFGVVQTPEDLVACEQLDARGFFHTVDHPVAGPLRYPGQTFDTTGGGFEIRRRPPLLGEHTEEILAGELGLGASAIGALRARGVI